MAVTIVNTTTLSMGSSGQYTDCLYDPPEITTPNADEVLAIPNGETLRVGWTEVSGADFYILHLSFNRDFRGPTVRGWRIDAPGSGAGGSGSDAYDFSKQFTVGEELRAGYDHYVRVFAFSEDGCSSEASETVAFNIAKRAFVVPELSSDTDASESASGSASSASEPPASESASASASEPPDFDCGNAFISLATGRGPLNVYNNQFDTVVSVTAAITVIFPDGISSYGIEWYSDLPGYGSYVGGSYTNDFTISPDTEPRTYDVVCVVVVGNTRCSELIRIEVQGEEPPTESETSSGKCTWELANGCYALAQIVDEQEDCYVVDRLFVKFVNGLMYVGNANCSSGNGCG